MRYYSRDGLTFDVDDSGPQEGEVVVLLHGWPQDRTAWDKVTPRLVDAGVRVLAPDLQDHMRPLFDGRHDVEATMVVTRVATGWPLLPAAPKVNGSMRAEAGGSGELVVRTNYVFAYAFAAPEPGRVTGPLDIVAMNRVVMDYVVRSGPDVRDTSRGLWTDQSSGFTYSMSCDAIDRGFLAPSIADPRMDGPAVAEREPEQYFDPDQPLPTEDGCVD